MRIGTVKGFKIQGIMLGLLGGLVMAAAAWASEGGSHGHGGIDPNKLPDLLWRTVNFVIFAGILYKLAAKPIKQFFAGRKVEISTELQDLETEKIKVLKALKEAKAQLAAVAAEREQIIQQYIAEGEAEKAKIIEKAEQTAQRLKEMATMTIEGETKKAAAELKKEIVDTAVKLSEQLIKEKIVPEDQQRLVDDYLAKVVEAH
jgi:F-type H+-transporting ATPase subunit b